MDLSVKWDLMKGLLPILLVLLEVIKYSPGKGQPPPRGGQNGIEQLFVTTWRIPTVGPREHERDIVLVSVLSVIATLTCIAIVIMLFCLVKKRYQILSNDKKKPKTIDYDVNLRRKSQRIRDNQYQDMPARETEGAIGYEGVNEFDDLPLCTIIHDSEDANGGYSYLDDFTHYDTLGPIMPDTLSAPRPDDAGYDHIHSTITSTRVPSHTIPGRDDRGYDHIPSMRKSTRHPPYMIAGKDNMGYDQIPSMVTPNRIAPHTMPERDDRGYDHIPSMAKSTRLPPHTIAGRDDAGYDHIPSTLPANSPATNSVSSKTMGTDCALNGFQTEEIYDELQEDEDHYDVLSDVIDVVSSNHNSMLSEDNHTGSILTHEVIADKRDIYASEEVAGQREGQRAMSKVHKYGESADMTEASKVIVAENDLYERGDLAEVTKASKIIVAENDLYEHVDSADMTKASKVIVVENDLYERGTSADITKASKVIVVENDLYECGNSAEVTKASKVIVAENDLYERGYSADITKASKVIVIENDLYEHGDSAEVTKPSKVMVTDNDRYKPAPLDKMPKTSKVVVEDNHLCKHGNQNVHETNLTGTESLYQNGVVKPVKVLLAGYDLSRGCNPIGGQPLLPLNDPLYENNVLEASKVLVAEKSLYESSKPTKRQNNMTLAGDFYQNTRA